MAFQWQSMTQELSSSRNGLMTASRKPSGCQAGAGSSRLADTSPAQCTQFLSISWPFPQRRNLHLPHAETRYDFRAVEQMLLIRGVGVR